jgi:hypothetical protein
VRAAGEKDRRPSQRSGNRHSSIISLTAIPPSERLNSAQSSPSDGTSCGAPSELLNRQRSSLSPCLRKAKERSETTALRARDSKSKTQWGALEIVWRERHSAIVRTLLGSLRWDRLR